MAGVQLPALAHVLQAFNNGAGFMIHPGEHLTITQVDQGDMTVLGVKQNGSQGWFPGQLIRFGVSPHQEEAMRQQQALQMQQQQQQQMMMMQQQQVAQQQALYQQAFLQQQAIALQQQHQQQAAAVAASSASELPSQAAPAPAAGSSQADPPGVEAHFKQQLLGDASPAPASSKPILALTLAPAGSKKVFRGANGLLDPAWWDHAQQEWAASKGIQMSHKKQPSKPVLASVAPSGAQQIQLISGFPYNMAPNPDASYKNGLFGCCSDCSVAAFCFCLPCSLARAQAMADGRSCVLTDLCCCPCPLQIRKETKAKFGIPQSGCSDCIQFALCCPLAHCADVRELKYRYEQAHLAWSCCGTMEKTQ